MNIMFLTLLDFKTYEEHNIYCDLMREFIKDGHEVYCISPTERKNGIDTHWEENGRLLKLKIGNIQKTNILEKGISTLVIEPMFVYALKKYFGRIKFDLILYSTPPITLVSSVSYLKRRDHAMSYLLLKDIFPQNAVDIGMLEKEGIKGLLYKYFRRKEIKLYKISDKIGCMSKANVDYVLKNNSYIAEDKVEICPNCVEPTKVSLTWNERIAIREKYNIPVERKVFVYGGNLGKPQGISFLIDCLRSQENNESVFFLIVGGGTEYKKIEEFVVNEKPQNVKLMKQLPRKEYDSMISACDVGMIFLDHRFTIPNFPSRLLSYMKAKLPILVCTDKNTDLKNVVCENKFGWWCESKDRRMFVELIEKIMREESEFRRMGENGNIYMEENYTAENACKIICKSCSNKVTNFR